jgi:16S rRNA C1402 N4-methylase RsmH
MPPLTRLAQEFVAGALRPGDLAIDGTVGNGWDTLFLARAVGPAGRVWGFDVQSAALERARTRLTEGAMDNVRLVLACHAEIARWLTDADRGRVRGAMFNLGYLPGDGAGVQDDPGPITQPDTTVAALRTALEFLASEGRLTVLCYRGHAGGSSESQAVENLLASLDSTRYRVDRNVGPRDTPTGPVLWTVESLMSQTATP